MNSVFGRLLCLLITNLGGGGIQILIHILVVLLIDY